jgi:hypothetical protein
MRVYVATRGDEIGMARTRHAYGLLEAAGHEITHKWPDEIDQARAKGWMTDKEVPRDQRRKFALADLDDGVLAARVFIYIAPHEKSEGAAAEMMAAIMKERDYGHPVTICVGEANTLFATLCTHMVESIEDALAVLEALRGSRFF